jgi:hypothetical protein
MQRVYVFLPMRRTPEVSQLNGVLERIPDIPDFSKYDAAIDARWKHLNSHLSIGRRSNEHVIQHHGIALPCRYIYAIFRYLRESS